MKMCFAGMFAGFILGGCAGAITYSTENFRATVPKPLVTPVAATVGLYFSPETRDYRYRERSSFGNLVTIEVHLGLASVSLFDQLVEGMFDEVVSVSKPPSDRQPDSEVDGILGIRVSGFRESHASISITYEITLYTPKGIRLGQWEVSGAGPTVLGWELRKSTDVALRQAAAEFVATFQDQQAVKKWISRLQNARRETAPLPP